MNHYILEILPNVKLLLIVRDPIGIIGSFLTLLLLMSSSSTCLRLCPTHLLLPDYEAEYPLLSRDLTSSSRPHPPDINKFLLESEELRDTKYDCKLGRPWKYLMYQSLGDKHLNTEGYIYQYLIQRIWTDTCIRYGVLCSNVLTTPASGISWPLIMKR